MPRLDTLLDVLRLKALPRAGWVRMGVPAPETVASHSWGVGWLVLALAPDELEVGRALAYATLHDLPEVRIGDFTPRDGVSREEKSRREAEAMRSLAAPFPERVQQLWDAYEAQADPEARFVRELDRLDMALQALAHHQAGHAGMLEFVESAEAVVRHASLKPLLAELRARLLKR